MMSRTHLAVGVSTSLLITLPNTPESCVIATMGGLLGGIIPDIDILKDDYTGDARFGQFLAAGVTAGILFTDYVFGTGICEQLFSTNKIRLFCGIILLIGLYIFGMGQKHRGFTHSFLAMGIYSIPIVILFPPLVIPFMSGYFSHICIDLLNKKKVQIFYPFKGGICFGICYASKLGNKILMYLGVFMSVILIIYCLF